MSKTKRYPGTIEQRGRSFRVILHVGGRRHAFTLRNVSRREAEDFAIAKHAELEEQRKRRLLGLPDSIRFSQLLELYKAQELPTLARGTQEAYADSFKPIVEYFVERLGDPFLERIHAKHIKGFLSWRKVNRRRGSGPLSNRTVAKDRAVLHRLFAFAERLEYRDGNPVARVEAPKADPRDPVILTDAQYEALLEVCAERPMLYLYVLTLGETGGRAYSEVLRLRWEDVDLAGGFIWIPSNRQHRTKSGKGRWVPMSKRLLEAMRAHFAAYRWARYNGKTSPWIFHHTTTRRHHKAGERIKDMRRAFDAAARRAGLPEGFHRHDLRHRRVTTWLAQGKDVVKVKEAVGHSDLRTTMGYTHLAREHLRDLVDDGPPAPARQTSRS